MTTPDSELWRERLSLVGAAQGRYFSALALAGLFYYALDAQVSSTRNAPEQVELPFVSGQVAAATLQSTAPIVMGFLLLAVLGATKAVSTAAKNVNSSGAPSFPEAMDKSFNLLDAVSYTTSDTPQRIAWILSFAYPGLLIVFWIEGSVFLIEDFARTPSQAFPDIEYPLWQVISSLAVRSLGGLLMLAAAVRLFRLLSHARARH